MNVGTSTSAITIHQKIAASASVPPEGSASPASTQGAAPAASDKPAKSIATTAATSGGGSSGSAENPVVAILKEQIARLQKELASEQKQLADASKATPKDGGPNVAAAGLQNQVQSTIAALLKATAALATFMSSASSGVDVSA